MAKTMLILAAAALLIGPTPNSNRNIHHIPSGGAATQFEFPLSVQKDIHRISADLHAANAKQPSPEEIERDRGNLKAQKQMARWAKWMFFAAMFEASITLTGVILVWQTLKATWAAKDEAKRASDAAERSLDQAQIYGKQELRAYLGMGRPHAQIMKGKPFEIVVPIKNFGRTPARNIHRTLNGMITPLPLIPEIFAAHPPRINRAGSLDPDAEFNTSIGWMGLTDADYKSLVEGAKAIVIWGETRYQDVFDDWHVTRFFRTCSGSEIEMARFRFVDDLNDST